MGYFAQNNNLVIPYIYFFGTKQPDTQICLHLQKNGPYPYNSSFGGDR